LEAKFALTLSVNLQGRVHVLAKVLLVGLSQIRNLGLNYSHSFTDDRGLHQLKIISRYHDASFDLMHELPDWRLFGNQPAGRSLTWAIWRV